MSTSLSSTGQRFTNLTQISLELPLVGVADLARAANLSLFGSERAERSCRLRARLPGDLCAA